MTEAGEYDRGQHLELIQDVVGRLASNSFMVKGWSLTVAGVFGAIAADRENWAIPLAALLPSAAFWVLDAYYLRFERLYRCLYEDVAARPTHDWSMDATGLAGEVDSLRQTCMNGILALLHLGIVLALIVESVMLAIFLRS